VKRRDIRLIQAAAVMAVALAFMAFRSLSGPKGALTLPGQDGFYYVARAVDGDTLKLSNGERVRLIGIDTPELHYSEKLERDAKRSRRDMAEIQELGRKAADFTRSLCEGKRVKLESDVTKKDRYGRRLAYVYLEDGTFVNAKIVEEGYAQVMTIPPNVRYSDTFLRLQREARGKGKGLWGMPEGMPR
jgi:micrococcal nuclease